MLHLSQNRSKSCAVPSKLVTKVGVSVLSLELPQPAPRYRLARKVFEEVKVIKITKTIPVSNLWLAAPGVGVPSEVSKEELSYPYSLTVRLLYARRSDPQFLYCGTDYLQGKIKVDEYVTHSRTLADINKGFDDMHVSHRLFNLTHCSISFFLRPAIVYAVSWICHKFKAHVVSPVWSAWKVASKEERLQSIMYV